MYNKYNQYQGGRDNSGRRGPNSNNDYRRGQHGHSGGYYGNHGGSGYRGGGGPSGQGSHAFSHKPKLEEDYRNKNIHKFKRMHGSSVMSPRTERMLAE